VEVAGRRPRIDFPVRKPFSPFRGRRESTMADVKEMTKPKADGSHGQAKESSGLAAREEKQAPRPAERAPSPALREGSPFAFIRRFAEEMDRLFEDFGFAQGPIGPGLLSRGEEWLRREAGLAGAHWSPHVDVTEHEGRLMVRADLPGLARDDVKVHVTGDSLTIEGERRQEKSEERKGRHYSECRYGRFYRAIPLPEGADPSKASAEFRNGVLEVTMPAATAPEKKGRRLEIREGK
jgi:HSP20 family protein